MAFQQQRRSATGAARPLVPCRGSRLLQLWCRRSAARQTPVCFLLRVFFCFKTSFQTLKHTRGEELNPDPSRVRSAHTGGALFAERAAQIKYVNGSSARVMRSRSLFTRLAALTLLFSFYHSKLSRATAPKCFPNFVSNEYLMFA